MPEAGDQRPQHQTHPHEPEEHHSQPVVFGGAMFRRLVKVAAALPISIGFEKLRTSFKNHV
jgi:hypothetical protein